MREVRRRTEYMLKQKKEKKKDISTRVTKRIRYVNGYAYVHVRTRIPRYKVTRIHIYTYICILHLHVHTRARTQMKYTLAFREGTYYTDRKK